MECGSIFFFWRPMFNTHKIPPHEKNAMKNNIAKKYIEIHEMAEGGWTYKCNREKKSRKPNPQKSKATPDGKCDALTALKATSPPTKMLKSTEMSLNKSREKPATTTTKKISKTKGNKSPNRRPNETISNMLSTQRCGVFVFLLMLLFIAMFYERNRS